MTKTLQLLLLFCITATTAIYAQNYPTTEWIDFADVTWYDASSDNFSITTAEELAGLAELVQDGNTFSGKTINIDADIDLDGNL